MLDQALVPMFDDADFAPMREPLRTHRAAEERAERDAMMEADDGWQSVVALHRVA